MKMRTIIKKIALFFGLILVVLMICLITNIIRILITEKSNQKVIETYSSNDYTENDNMASFNNDKVLFTKKNDMTMFPFILSTSLYEYDLKTEKTKLLFVPKLPLSYIYTVIVGDKSICVDDSSILYGGYLSMIRSSGSKKRINGIDTGDVIFKNDKLYYIDIENNVICKSFITKHQNIIYKGGENKNCSLWCVDKKYTYLITSHLGYKGQNDAIIKHSLDGTKNIEYRLKEGENVGGLISISDNQFIACINTEDNMKIYLYNNINTTGKCIATLKNKPAGEYEADNDFLSYNLMYYKGKLYLDDSIGNLRCLDLVSGKISNVIMNDDYSNKITGSDISFTFTKKYIVCESKGNSDELLDMLLFDYNGKFIKQVDNF